MHAFVPVCVFKGQNVFTYISKIGKNVVRRKIMPSKQSQYQQGILIKSASDKLHLQTTVLQRI